MTNVFLSVPFPQKWSIPTNGAHHKDRHFKSCWKLSKTNLARNGDTDFTPSSNGHCNDKCLTYPDTPAFQTDQLGSLSNSSSYHEVGMGWHAISTSSDLELNWTALQLAEQTFYSAKSLLKARFPASPTSSLQPFHRALLRSLFKFPPFYLAMEADSHTTTAGFEIVTTPEGRVGIPLHHSRPGSTLQCNLHSERYSRLKFCLGDQ